MSNKRKAEGIALLSVYGDDESEEELEDNQEESNGFAGTALEGGVGMLEDEDGREFNALELLTSRQVNRVTSMPLSGGDGVSDRGVVALQPLHSIQETFSKQTSETPPKSFSPSRNKSTRIISTTAAQLIPGKGIIIEKKESFSVVTEVHGNGSTADHSPMDVDEAEEEKPNAMGEGPKDETELKVGLKSKVKGSEEEEYAEVLNYFPALPSEECSSDLQGKFTRYLELKKIGKSLNKAQRESKGYRNPDFMQKRLEHEGIFQYGSSFSAEVFDPNGLDPSDYAETIVSEQRMEAERKEKERRMKNQIEFQKGEAHHQIQSLSGSKFQTPLVQIVSAQKPPLGIPNPLQTTQQAAFPNMAPSSLFSASISSSASLAPTSSAPSSTSSSILPASQPSSGKAEPRTKKSKWDKMESTEITSIVSGGDSKSEEKPSSKVAEASHPASSKSSTHADTKKHDHHKKERSSHRK